MTTAERVRLVPCGCGRCKLLIDPRGGRKYAPGHKQGAYRERLKRAAAAQGVPAAVSFATLNALPRIPVPEPEPDRDLGQLDASAALACAWCYRPLPLGEGGRYCSAGCARESSASPACEYCGEAAQAKDHVIPRAYRRMMDGDPAVAALLAKIPDTVPACHECNSLAGSDVFPSLDTKRSAIQKALARRYTRLLLAPRWSTEEVADLDGRLRQAVESAEAKRVVVLTRLRWTGNPRS